MICSKSQGFLKQYSHLLGPLVAHQNKTARPYFFEDNAHFSHRTWKIQVEIEMQVLPNSDVSMPY